MFYYEILFVITTVLLLFCCRIFEKSKPVLLDSLQKVSMPGTGLDIIPEHLVPTIRAWLAIRRQVGYLLR